MATGVQHFEGLCSARRNQQRDAYLVTCRACLRELIRGGHMPSALQLHRVERRAVAGSAHDWQTVTFPGDGPGRMCRICAKQEVLDTRVVDAVRGPEPAEG